MLNGDELYMLKSNKIMLCYVMLCYVDSVFLALGSLVTILTFSR